jgi:hypothetical protein
VALAATQGNPPAPALQLIYSSFMYYATGGNDPYHMPLNSFTSFLDDAAIPDPDSLLIKRSDCDTIFIVCNFQPDKNSPDVAVNDEHAMMRFEFLEAIVRLGKAAGRDAQSVPTTVSPAHTAARQIS